MVLSNAVIPVLTVAVFTPAILLMTPSFPLVAETVAFPGPAISVVNILYKTNSNIIVDATAASFHALINIVTTVYSTFLVALWGRLTR